MFNTASIRTEAGIAEYLTVFIRQLRRNGCNDLDIAAALRAAAADVPNVDPHGNP